MGLNLWCLAQSTDINANSLVPTPTYWTENFRDGASSLRLNKPFSGFCWTLKFEYQPLAQVLLLLILFSQLKCHSTISLFRWFWEGAHQFIQKGQLLLNAYYAAGVVLCTFTHWMVTMTLWGSIITGHWDMERLGDLAKTTLLLAGKRYSNSRTHALHHTLILPDTIQLENLYIQQRFLKS